MPIKLKESSQELYKEFFLQHTLLNKAEPDMRNAVDIILTCFKNGNKLLVCGNGGSSSDADHIVGELMKGFVKKRHLKENFRKKAETMYGDSGLFIADNLQQGLPAISLTCQTALMTAFLNDCNPELLYAQQVNALMKQGDVLLAISTSGNAKNVANAARTAKILGNRVVGLTGGTGGILKTLSDVSIISPQSETYKIQEDHLPIYHLICLIIENELFE